ncbi:MAG: hypothetical protein H7Z40_07230, partial [Phycisphaerae bacterium]|nr:hypothetical protein [Gemmatimonadaceae bacterium]
MTVPRCSRRYDLRAAALIATAFWPAAMSAQGTAADYTRADSLGRRFQNLVANVAERPNWIDATRFWYRKSVVGGNSFVVADTRTATKTAAFDHERLASGLNAAATQKYTAVTLPFADFSYEGTTAVRVVASSSMYSCALSDYVCTRTGPAPSPTFTPGAGRGGNPFFEPENDSPTEVPWDTDDGSEADVFAQRAWATQLLQQQQRAPQSDTNVVRSPDGALEAYIWNYNIFVRPVVRNDEARSGRGGAPVGGRGGEAIPAPPTGTQLSWNGSEGHPYVMGPAGQRSLRWSPDSKK